jgi:hypothetical protein
MKVSILFAAALTLLSINAFASHSRDGVYDRQLTRAEMEKLLPSYVATADAASSTLPSPSDNDDLGMTAYAITNPIYSAFRNNKIVGQQSHTIDSLIQELESTVRDLKERSAQERRQEYATVLEGFKGRISRKVSCQLGYSSASKVSTERIVKCVDNRSEAGTGGDDEGYSDVRTIILSIDAKTLAPVSLLKIDQFTAG